MDREMMMERFCDTGRNDCGDEVCAKMEEVCEELRRCSPDMGGQDRERLERRMSEVRQSFETCDMASGMEGVCDTFFTRADDLIRDCRSV